MTAQEFHKRMVAIAKKSDDIEARHGDADDLLCEALRELKYKKGVKVFEEMDKWYA